MEKEIEKIKELLNEFMEKYNVTVEVETSAIGRDFEGRIIRPEANLIIHS